MNEINKDCIMFVVHLLSITYFVVVKGLLLLSFYYILPVSF